MGLITLPTRIEGKVFARILKRQYFKPSVVSVGSVVSVESACNRFCLSSCMLAAAA